MVDTKYATYLNLESTFSGGTLTVRVETDVEDPIDTLPLVAAFLHSVIHQTGLKKEEVMDLLSSTIGRMETIHHVDAADFH